MPFRLLHLRCQEDTVLLKTHPRDERFLWTTFRQLVSMKTKSVEMVDASEAHGALRRKPPPPAIQKARIDSFAALNLGGRGALLRHTVYLGLRSDKVADFRRGGADGQTDRN
jgi:hypothetical protein